MPTLCRQVEFTAAHFYWNPGWSEEENHQVFRGCANRHGHGHNYQVQVVVAGDIDPTTGMIINFFDLDPLLHRVIIAPLDHKHLNHDVPHFTQTIPTLENIALYLWKHLAPEIAEIGLRLHRIKVIEHPELYVEYDGEAA